jgi:hypothetical protein
MKPAMDDPVATVLCLLFILAPLGVLMVIAIRRIRSSMWANLGRFFPCTDDRHQVEIESLADAK